MTDFFTAFWPNLAATLIGVALGLPVALYLNRLVTSQSRAHEDSQKNKLLSDALYTLIEACNYNIRVLNDITDLSVEAEIMRNPDLRTTTWDSLSGILVNHLNDPDLLQITSHHWLRLKRLEDLNYQVFAMQTGQSPSPQQSVSLESFIFELHRTASGLADHATEISEFLQTARDKVAPNNSLKPTPLRGAA